MWKTIAKFIGEPVYQKVQKDNFFVKFWEATLENKEGEFKCSFGKKYLRRILLEEKPRKGEFILLECKKSFSSYICRKIEFLNNNEELTPWQWEETHSWPIHNEPSKTLSYKIKLLAEARFEIVKQRLARLKAEGKEITREKEELILNLCSPYRIFEAIKEFYFSRHISIFDNDENEEENNGEDFWWWGCQNNQKDWQEEKGEIEDGYCKGNYLIDETELRELTKRARGGKRYKSFQKKRD